MRNFWENTNWEETDLHLSELKEAPFQRTLPSLHLQPGLFIIRGPRQVGKSSWLKLELSKAVKERAAKNVFFESCENLRDHLDLADLLKKCKSCSLICLDEVTFVKDWGRAIKHFMDSEKNKILLITGSNAIDLRKGTDRMPGRHRAGGEYTLLPMSFNEFLKARTEAGWISGSETDRTYELENYFRVGGFPAAVIEAGAKAQSPTKAIEIYARWLLGDAIKFGKNEIYLKEICSQIFLTSQTPISLQKLAQRTQMGSHHTAHDYINVLEDSFALTQLYAIDPNTGAKRSRKDKKLYFRDPLIYAIAKKWSDDDCSDVKYNELIAESVACEHLLRSYPRFGYLHSQKGEIDFYSRGKWALEVKWSVSTQNLSKVFKDLRIPWKEVWNPKNFLLEYPPLIA